MVFAMYINMNQPQVYMCPHPLELPSHLPPHPIPPGFHRTLALGPCVIHQTPTSCLFYMVMYMFQCCSLQSSQPLILPLCPKPVFYVFVFSAAPHIGSSVPSF